MRRALLIVLALLLAPLALLLSTFAGVWGEAAFDRRDPAALQRAVEAHCPVDAMLVMGAAQYDGRPSDALMRRLRAAEALLGAGCSDTLVVSGGSREGDRTTEGATGVAWLEAQGVSGVRLIAEESATNTLENLQRSAALLPGVRWLVITDDLHASRTRYSAGALGLEAVVLGVPTGHERLRYALREVLALLAYRYQLWR